VSPRRSEQATDKWRSRVLLRSETNEAEDCDDSDQASKGVSKRPSIEDIFRVLSKLRRADTIESCAAPAKNATFEVVVESSFILTISPPMSTTPAATAVNVTVPTVSSPLELHPDDGLNPHEPNINTSFCGSLVVHSKLDPQPLP
jgi:hypothetical protein